MTSKKRICSIVSAAALCLFVLLSSVYVISEVNHDCTGEDCPVCCQISMCKHTLKTISTAATASAFAVLFIDLLKICLSAGFENRRPKSLVTLKVKLSN